MEYALVLLWLVAFQALAFVGLPVAARLFPRFPDRGAALSLPVSLFVATTVVYWVGHLSFGRWTAALGVLAVAGLSALVVWNNRPRVYKGLIRPRAYAEAVTVFTVAFLFLVAVRAVDPAIVPGGGEKFLDFGIFKSLMRAEALPPEDMWWAGDHVMYYYGGHLMAAVLSSLTGTAPRYAYNLALAGFYASLVTAVYGLGGAVADARGASSRVGGVFAAFLVGFASNLVAPVVGLIWVLPQTLASQIADRVADALRDSGGELSSSGQLVLDGIGEFSYWAPSRVIPGTINEFPLFAFYNGDLHGHMLSTQFLILAAALGYAYFRTPPENRGRRRLLAFGVLPAVVALLGLVNVWSLPTGLGVVWLALVFAPADPLTLFPGVSARERAAPVPDGGGEPSPATALLGEGRRVAAALAATGVVGALAVVWLSPFLVGVLLASSSSRSLAFLPDQSTAVGLLLVHGAFLAVFAGYLWPRAREAFDTDAVRVGGLAALAALLAWLAGYPVVVLVVPLLAVGWLLLRADGSVGYEAVLLIAGAGLVTLVEFAYVEDNAIAGRFNTVFKVYMQVWVLWGTAAGAMLAALVSDRVAPAARPRSVGGFDVSRGDLAAVGAAVLLVSTGLYGGLTMQDHFTTDGELATDDATLDGLAYLETQHPDEAEAIHWLDDREGRPHVVTAPGSPYQWSSPVPSLTGLPAVVGWVYQEGAYRGYDVADRREEDVDFIYTDASWENRAELLAKYDVEYVYVGPLERERYDGEDLRFGDRPGYDPVFENDGVVVYRVDYSELETGGSES
ncbi:DUF2298 domain-containing protein [Halorussus salilacus]|uniref:DUF2298 domain-containing protein n=1 Tax=Halorussus salilacus TaxID=2953750 RepID=UPI00209E2145|nr:DUF2298 domain-containing protein [Halorussus salilacus]USZ68792.1 DUF2298 domain-containing protein [Halorussus salilacus]